VAAAAAVADDVRAAGDVDLGAVRWRRTVERRCADVDSVATGVCRRRCGHRVRRRSAAVVVVAVALGELGDDARLVGGRRTTVGRQRRR